MSDKASSQTVAHEEHKMSLAEPLKNQMKTWVHRHQNDVDDSDRRNIVLAVDGDSTSDRAFQFVTKQASSSDTIHIVHASAEGDNPQKAESLKILSRYADKCAALKKHCQLETIFYSGGDKDIAKAIAEKTKQIDATQLVVGHRSQSEEKKKMGSVSRYLLERSPCPLLIVKDVKGKGQSVEDQVSDTHRGEW
ncbi:hypothetical protein PROFUN_00232 [Planoprotostelium fungivorum]|uniref:UspA domain-containing protein n=1 Tax=Planoprotostelium fungivorum TaxID=1890364 RepID=A0A2P6NXT2_9EUKA|nr:hypothetical protein PROFUN_00232 [Planoprotostelium fungivorum]